MLLSGMAAATQASAEQVEAVEQSGLLATMGEMVGSPPNGVAPLNQFCEAWLLACEAMGVYRCAPSSNAEVLQEHMRVGDSHYYLQRIRTMVERGGWAEADATVVQLGLWVVARGIGFAVRTRRTVASAFCHGM